VLLVVDGVERKSLGTSFEIMSNRKVLRKRSRKCNSILSQHLPGERLRKIDDELTAGTVSRTDTAKIKTSEWL
jgi:hypothetical protein